MGTSNITARFERLSKKRNHKLLNNRSKRGNYYNEIIYLKCCEFTTNKTVLQERYLASKLIYNYFQGVMPSKRLINQLIKNKPVEQSLETHLKKMKNLKVYSPKKIETKTEKPTKKAINDDFWSWRQNHGLTTSRS